MESLPAEDNENNKEVFDSKINMENDGKIIRGQRKLNQEEEDEEEEKDDIMNGKQTKEQCPQYSPTLRKFSSSTTNGVASIIQ